jgi:hypothetical protein
MSSNVFKPKDGINSLEYLLLFAKSDPTVYPYYLESTGLGNPTQNLTDVLKVVYTEYVRGERVQRERVSRAAKELSRDYEVKFPYGAISDPLLDHARYHGDCVRDLIGLYLCPDEEKYGHYIVFKDTTYDPPVEAEALITVDDQNMVGETTQAHVQERWVRQKLYGFGRATATVTVDAVSFKDFMCAGCSGDPNDYGVVGGGDGTAAPYLATTDDEFSTLTAATITGATAGYYVTDVYRINDTIIVTLADDTDPTAATAGQIAVSQDGGTSWSIVSGATQPYFDIVMFSNTLYIVGGGGQIWYSNNYGSSWSQLSQSVTTNTLTAAAADEENSKLYIVGIGGIVLLVQNDTASDLTSTVSAGGVNLFSVAVIDAGHIVIGGASGFFSESTDDGDTFTQKSVAGSSADILALAGERWRLLVGAGTTVYERSVLTSMIFETVDYKAGLSPAGSVVGIDMGDNGNMYVIAHSSGEIVVYRPDMPDYTE